MSWKLIHLCFLWDNEFERKGKGFTALYLKWMLRWIHVDLAEITLNYVLSVVHDSFSSTNIDWTGHLPLAYLLGAPGGQWTQWASLASASLGKYAATLSCHVVIHIAPGNREFQFQPLHYISTFPALPLPPISVNWPCLNTKTWQPNFDIMRWPSSSRPRYSIPLFVFDKWLHLITFVCIFVHHANEHNYFYSRHKATIALDICAHRLNMYH